MRALNISCGIAVLLTTLALGHLIHHHYLNASPNDLHNPSFLASLFAAVVVGVLSFIGGCLLVRRAR